MNITPIVGFLIVSSYLITLMMDPNLYATIDSRDLNMVFIVTFGFVLIAYPLSQLITLLVSLTHIFYNPPFILRYWQERYEAAPDSTPTFQLSIDDLKVIEDIALSSSILRNIKYIFILVCLAVIALNVNKPINSRVPVSLIGIFIFLLCHTIQLRFDGIISFSKKAEFHSTLDSK